MDFSKIKKIFYIVAIISILLSIKSRVLGASDIKVTLIKGGSDGVGGVTYTATLPSFLNDKYWVIQQISKSNGEYITYLYYSDDSFSITSNSSNGLFGKYINQVNLSYSGTDNNYTYDENFIGFSNSSISGTYQLNTTWLNSTTWIYGNFDLYINNNLANIENFIPRFTYPSFDNTNEIEQGYPDGVLISRGSYSENDTLYFHLLKITNTVNDSNNTIYYYSPKIFALNKDSKYYRTYDADTENKYSYYYINRSALTLDTNSSYLYVLSNSSESYTNSYGILQPDIPGGIYDVIQSDTTGVITSQDSTNDKIQNIDDTLNDNNISSDTETNIEDSLNFDNKNEGLNNLNNGFFSRLTSMLSNLLGYNLSDDTAVSIPFPNSEKHLILHSKDIHDHVNGAIRVIINAFWVYVFSYYLWKFINKIYISVSSGNILDSFSSSGEAITNNML